MLKITVGMVLKQMPRAFLYLIIGSLLGITIGFVLFYTNKPIFELILVIWSRKILFGAEFFGSENYSLWFIINNLIALLLVVTATIMILTHISKTPTFYVAKRFRKLEKHRPKITVFGLYIIPIGAVIINGFLISLFATYVLLIYEFGRFFDVMMLLLPHGIGELLALLLASSLGLAYLKILTPLILKKKWKSCIKTGEQLLKSRTTLFIVIAIIVLVIFSGLLEGSSDWFVT